MLYRLAKDSYPQAVIEVDKKMDSGVRPDISISGINALAVLMTRIFDNFNHCYILLLDTGLVMGEKEITKDDIWQYGKNPVKAVMENEEKLEIGMDKFEYYIYIRSNLDISRWWKVKPVESVVE